MAQLDSDLQPKGTLVNSLLVLADRLGVKETAIDLSKVRVAEFIRTIVRSSGLGWRCQHSIRVGIGCGE